MMQELDSLVQTLRIFSSSIGIQFGISKCAMIETKRGKVVQNEGIELPNGETIKSLEDKKRCKYLGVLQFDSVESKEMKDMITREYYQRIKKILKVSLHVGNTIQAINVRAVPIIRYETGKVERRKKDLEAIDRKTRKLLIMCRSLAPRADVDRLY